MVAHAVGVAQKQDVPAVVSVASTHDAKSKRLCGSSPAVPHLSNSICRSIRPEIGRKNFSRTLRGPRRLRVLLAAGPLSSSLCAGLADSFTCVVRAVPVSDKHGESAAVCHHLSDRGDPLLLQAEILAVAAAGAGLHLDLRPVSASGA